MAGIGEDVYMNPEFGVIFLQHEPTPHVGDDDFDYVNGGMLLGKVLAIHPNGFYKIERDFYAKPLYVRTYHTKTLKELGGDVVMANIVRYDQITLTRSADITVKIQAFEDLGLDMSKYGDALKAINQSLNARQTKIQQTPGIFSRMQTGILDGWEWALGILGINGLPMRGNNAVGLAPLIWVAVISVSVLGSILAVKASDWFGDHDNAKKTAQLAIETDLRLQEILDSLTEDDKKYVKSRINDAIETAGSGQGFFGNMFNSVKILAFGALGYLVVTEYQKRR